jgi:hypothetical protein
VPISELGIILKVIARFSIFGFKSLIFIYRLNCKNLYHKNMIIYWVHMASREELVPPFVYIILGELFIIIGLSLYSLYLLGYDNFSVEPTLGCVRLVVSGIFFVFYALYKHIRYPLLECKKCGHRFATNHRFCNNCGTRLRK